jgi:hypothetical protein
MKASTGYRVYTPLPIDSHLECAAGALNKVPIENYFLISAWRA